MPRDLGTAAAEAAKKLGAEPIIIVEVDWGDAAFPTSPTLSYADKDYDGLDGKILVTSGLDAIIKLGSTGATADISITLDDTDGSIKTIIDTNDVHKRPVRVYQAYGALAETDKFLLFDGVIETPITYSEGERLISLTVVGKVEDNEIGFSVEEGEFDWVAPSAIGKAWPLVFGSSIRVPALKLTESVRGVNQTNYGAVSLGNLDDLCSRVETMWDQDLAKQDADTDPGFTDENYAIVVDNLTSATIALNTFLYALIADSPTQEDDLRAYIDACLGLYMAERNLAFFGPLAVASEARLEELNGGPGPPPFPGEIAEKNAEVLQEQAAYIAEPTSLGLAKIEELQAEYQALSNEADTEQALLLVYTAQLLAANANVAIFTPIKRALENILAVIVVNPIRIENGEEFPQSPTVVKIVINGLIYQGTFAGEVFTVDEANLPADVGISLGSRLNDNANEFWLPSSSFDLKGKYCMFPEGLLFVDAQDGTRCYISPLLYEQTGELPNLLGGFDPAFTREIWDPILFGGTILETSVFLRSSWINSLESNGRPDFADGRSNLTLQDYNISVGDEVFLLSDYQDIYVANLIPSTEIREVMAYRLVNGIRRLVPIPSQYYTTNLSESIAGQTSTTIRMIRPLSQYNGENWEEQIYVTLVSTVGPNTADIISWIATTYTDLTPDAASFASVSAAIAAYPSHFPILDRPNALAVMEQIAWQARCAIYVKFDVLYIKYLSVEEASLATISESEIKFGTLELTMTESEQLVTKFIAEWIRDYSDEEEDNKVILRNNIPRYGKIEQTFKFFIYNIEGLVVKSATFWMLRYSNTWKMLKFQGFLDRLELETLDTVLISLPNEFLASTDVKGTVHKAEYNSSAQTIDYEVWTSVRAGEMVPYVFAWPASAPAIETYPTALDPFAGGT